MWLAVAARTMWGSMCEKLENQDEATCETTVMVVALESGALPAVLVRQGRLADGEALAEIESSHLTPD
jgi:hypothetical protein